MSFKRILVPVDFSHTSDAALRLGRDLAARLGARLHVLHVVPDPVTTPWPAPAFSRGVDEILDDLFRDIVRRLECLMPDADAGRPVARFATRAGDTGPEIIDYATTQQIDLIVMGTHGRSGLAHVLLGSVAEKVIRTASCPVLTVRGPDST